jgi:hypothetical protein
MAASSPALPRRFSRSCALSVERLEQDRGRVELATTPSRTSVEKLRARQADEQNRRVTREVGDVLDEIEQTRLCPVQVVEDEHERALVRESLEEAADGPERLVGRCGLERLLELPLGAYLLEDLDERPEGDSFAVREAAPGQNGCALPQLRHELDYEPRLADAGGPEDGEERARPLRDGALVRLAEQIEFAAATDERRVELALVPRRSRPHDNEAPGRDRLGLALQGERRDRFGFDGVPHEPARLLTEQNLAGTRRLLQSRGDVNSVAGGQALTRRLRGHDLARVDSYPRLNPDPEVPLELLAQRRESFAHLVRRPNRT